MAVLPIQREGWLSDNDALRRFTRRPQTIVDALYLSQKDLILGFLSAFAGTGTYCLACADLSAAICMHSAVDSVCFTPLLPRPHPGPI